MDKQKMADAMEALAEKYPEANITRIASHVPEENVLRIEINSTNAYCTESGDTSVMIDVNIDPVEGVDESVWDDGD